jgi:hypothetical protein
MRIHDQKVYDAVIKRCHTQPAEPYTAIVKVDGVDYCYMSEVDPHRDEPTHEETFWTIKFVATKPDYFFIYHFEGQRFCVEPELNTPYSFNFTQLHAFLHKDNVATFEDEEFWESTYPDTDLACIFVLI